MQEIEFIPVESWGEFNTLEPVPTIKNIPEWFKKMQGVKRFLSRQGKDGPEDFTIKKCIPVLDAFTTGYYLVTTFDTEWSINENNEHVCSFDAKFMGNMEKPITMHPFEQIDTIDLGGIYNDYAYKFINPFLIKTPPGYSCLFTHPFNQINPFLTLSGVVDTDMHPLAIQFPFLMIKGWEGVIKAGTPIVQIIPFKREEWKMYNVIPSKTDKRDSSRAMDEFYMSRYDLETKKVSGGEYKKKYRKTKKYL